jgi:hypothetical protein
MGRLEIIQTVDSTFHIFKRQTYVNQKFSFHEMVVQVLLHSKKEKQKRTIYYKFDE